MFRDNAIDADVLRDLTNDHLRELGLPLGARLKLLRAVATLGTSEQPPASPEITPTAPRTDAERRQLTIMFCDLVGSTALSTRFDPEDMQEIVGAYHRCCADLIVKAGGFVARYIGDGALVYFGYPQAIEHDTERAVRAGLSLVEAVPKLKTAAGAPLQVRNSRLAKRDAVEKPYRADDLVQGWPRDARRNKMNLEGADVFQFQPIRRFAEIAAELRNRTDVGSLRRRRQITDGHVLDHATGQRP